MKDKIIFVSLVAGSIASSVAILWLLGVTVKDWMLDWDELGEGNQNLLDENGEGNLIPQEHLKLR